MAITIHTQISIVMVEGTDQVKSATPKPPHYRIVRIRGWPGGEISAWALSVSERILGQEAQWAAQLSAAESQHLVTLLDEIPPQSMTHEKKSLDGTEYKLLVEDAEHSRSFYWHNDDWLRADDGSKEVWAQVSAIADHVMEVIERTRPASE